MCRWGVMVMVMVMVMCTFGDMVQGRAAELLLLLLLLLLLMTTERKLRACVPAPALPPLPLTSGFAQGRRSVSSARARVAAVVNSIREHCLVEDMPDSWRFSLGWAMAPPHRLLRCAPPACAACGCGACSCRCGYVQLYTCHICTYCTHVTFVHYVHMSHLFTHCATQRLGRRSLYCACPNPRQRPDIQTAPASARRQRRAHTQLRHAAHAQAPGSRTSMGDEANALRVNKWLRALGDSMP